MEYLRKNKKKLKKFDLKKNCINIIIFLYK